MNRYVVGVAVVMAAYGITALEPVTSHANNFPIQDNTQMASVAFAPQTDAVEKALEESVPKVESDYNSNWTASEKHRRSEELLAGMLFGECRGQSRDCMVAVGHVAMNRAREDLDVRYGKGLWGVLNKRKAFSCLNKNDPNRKMIEKAIAGKLKPGSKSAQKWAMAKEVAHELMHVGGEDPTAGSTHYFAHKLVSPKWIGDRGMVKVAKIDGHTFYRKEG